MRTPITHPANEIEYDDRKAAMEKVKVGTPVWLGSSEYPCKDGIAIISRVTNTQFVVDKNERYSAERRYRRENGFRIGGGMFAEHITAIATEEEIVAYSAQQAAEKARRTRIQNETKAVENLQIELNKLFTDDEPIYVRPDDFHKSNTFSITISGLTEEKVRELAPKLKKAVAGK